MHAYTQEHNYQTRACALACSILSEKVGPKDPRQFRYLTRDDRIWRRLTQTPQMVRIQ